MFLDVVKKWALKKRLQRPAPALTSWQVTHPPQSIGLLLTASSLAFIEGLYMALADQGIAKSQVYPLCVSDQPIPEPTAVPFCSYADLNWQGHWTHGPALAWMAHRFDILIQYADASHLLMDALSLESQARCKIGLASADPRWHPLRVQIALDHPHEAIREMFYYLSHIQTPHTP